MTDVGVGIMAMSGSLGCFGMPGCRDDAACDLRAGAGAARRRRGPRRVRRATRCLFWQVVDDVCDPTRPRDLLLPWHVKRGGKVFLVLSGGDSLL